MIDLEMSSLRLCFEVENDLSKSKKMLSDSKLCFQVNIEVSKLKVM